MPEELKPCPFCGFEASRPILTNPYKGRPIWEMGCAFFCVSMRDSSKKHLIERWNLRKETPKEKVEALVEALKDILADATSDGDFTKRIWPIRAANYRKAQAALKAAGVEEE